MKKAITISLVVLHIFVHSAFSQKIWTLDDCITYALNNNIQIKQQQISSKLSKLQYNQSIASLFPSINASASHVYNNGQTIDMYTNQFASQTVQSNNFYLSGSLVLFNGLQLLNTLKQKQIDFLASQYDLEKIKNDITLTIATAYLQVLYNIELLSVAKSQLDITNAQVERTKKLLDAGTIAKGTLLLIESQAATDELQVVTAQNQLDMAYLTLAQLLDLQDTKGFEIEQPELSIPESSALMQNVEDIFTKASVIQPDIMSAEMKVKSAKKGLSISYGALSPSLILNASYGSGYSGASKSISDITISGYTPIGATESGEIVYGPTYDYAYSKIKFWDQLDRNLNSSIGLYLNIPIFNKWQTQTAIGSSKLSLQNAELMLQNSKNQLLKTIQQAYVDAKAALNRYNAGIKSVEALRESFNYTEQRFNVGLVNSIDYNDAKNKLMKAVSESLNAKYEFVFRIKVLDFYQGKPLTIK
ncbi:MAG: TolC family protein [Bacteroidales bacterium]|jgi:outer membrane protein|nr:TolC family protein [Bacteroidales bacterium]MDD4214435.1 TolC family protein [Bacteroidales bacterium]